MGDINALGLTACRGDSWRDTVRHSTLFPYDAPRAEAPMALVTLQTIFQDAFPAYEQTHPLPTHVRRAARAIMQCRTAILGGHIQACPDGHMARVWYNSCRHRSCPQCAYLQTERWLAVQQARLLACDHSHVIFTLPHDRCRQELYQTRAIWPS